MNVSKFSIACPVRITAEALEEVKTILYSKNIPKEYGLRIGVNGGGCSGVSFFISFDTQKEKYDVYEIGNIKLFIEKRHTMFLWGVEVDFINSGEERGFIFSRE